MAIDRQKLLPGYGALVKQQRTANTSNRAASAKQTSFSDNVKNIDANFLNIDRFLNSRFKSDSKQFENEVKENNIRRRNLGFQRKALVKNTSGILENIKSGLNIRDTVNNFLGWTIAGYVTDKLFKYIPDILKFIERMKPAYEFLEEFAGNLVNGVVDFIDFGYDAYDTVKNFALSIVPDDLQKQLGDFDKKFNTFMNLAFIAAMLGTGGSGPQKRPPRRPPTRAGGARGTGGAGASSKLNRYLNRSPQFKSIQNKYGYDAARFFQSRREQGRSISGALNDVRSRFKPVKITSGLSSRTAAPGQVFNKGISRAAQRTSLKLLGRAGTTIARGIFKRIPVIGGLIDFVFSLAMGEPIGRAAAKAVGATVGAALGTFIPIPFAGTILGGILGDIVGGALYDTVVGMMNKNKKKSKVSGSARGGVTSAAPAAATSRTTPQAQRQVTAQTVSIPGDDADFWTLVAIVSREDGDPQGWADVAQSIYNRAASGRYGSKNIRELILGRMQYEPTWKFPYAGTTGEPNVEWKSIKDVKSAAAAAGFTISTMEDVARVLLSATYQAEARKFIGGRTDFKGASIKFPGSIQRKAGDNNFGWQYNYRGRIIGKPLRSPTTTTAPANSGVSRTPASSVYRDPQGKALLSQYVTGDRSYVGDNKFFYGNDALHGGTNYHDHYGFIDTAARDAAISFMRSKGWVIGSIDRNNRSGSLHDQARAFDIPMYANGRVQKGFEDSREGEEAFSEATRRDMRAGGFLPPEGVPFKEGGYMTRNRITGLNSIASYDDVEVQYIIQPIVNTKLVHRTSVAPMSMGAPSRSRNSIRNTFKA